MLKKIILGTLFTGLIGTLVAGAVIRTADRIDQGGDGSGQGRGRNAQAEVSEAGRQEGRSGGYGGNGQGDGSGSGQGQNSGGGQGGYAQNGGSQEYREGEGRQGNGGNGQGGNGNGQQAGSGQGKGTGLEVVEDWLTLEGTVAAVDEDALIVQVAEGEVLVDGRAWMYALELGFSTQEGHDITLTGFYEDGEFKAVELVDTTSGVSVAVRDQGGRPYWSGQGRGTGA
jgi:hypothetical protein